MDIPAAAAGPWIVLGVVLGVLLLSAAVLAAYPVLRDRAPTAGTEASPHAGDDDDLPGFLESPPGSAGAASGPVQGWAVLTAPSAPPAAAPPAPRSRWNTAGVLAALALVGALLVGVAAALAVASRSEHVATPSGRAAHEPAGDHLAARLTFDGVILERRTVGVTATYPHVRLESDGERTIAHVGLPTFNCLTAEAPDDPTAAGCTPAGTEYADLTTPALTVQREDGRVQISGRFETYLRPNGTPPVSTGRVYELEMTAEPVGEARPGTWLPATGELRLGDDRADATGGPDDRLRFED